MQNWCCVLQVPDRLSFTPSPSSPTSCSWRRPVTLADTHGETSQPAITSWENLGFDPVPTDYMYIMKCSEGDSFKDGGLQRFGNIELIPSACVLNYGQGIIEGLKAYKKQDGSILLFRPEENGLRIKVGADRMCMPAPTVEQFVDAVKLTVLANKRRVPPPDRGFLHVRPLLLGTGPVLSLTPAPEFTFLVYVTPVGNYFKGGLKPINLVVESKIKRATPGPGGVGCVKAIGNYAGILKAQVAAKENGFSDVLYLDSVHNRYLEELSTANVFIVKGKTISTPVLGGTILAGISRKSIIDIAHSQGFQVEERLVSVEELFDADEVFCTGNAVSVLPIGSITFLDKRGSLWRKWVCVSATLLSTYRYTKGSCRGQNGLDCNLEVEDARYIISLFL
ncbi:hypothetical protein SLEP1_g41986 [Rubroshorea leprosula]|uniref:Branched-chain-amino-acid aminotransferase n=1 Tax=Rubroshorea leprosula TaxID=152421 RepID=A0AAV5L8E5_9ROSI|nr:hypothetical protein SLEP1_g41986 [Rubroshorea leprosula]